MSTPIVEQRLKTLAYYRLPARAAMLLDRAVAGLPRTQPDILITGFWRSGTTWLQEVLARALNAKTIFEPLSPESTGRPVGAPWLSSSALALKEAWMPLTYAALGAEDCGMLDAVFLGCALGRFSLHCRMSVLESFRPRSIIKCVRAAFLVPELMKRHELYGLHIRRHPGAVVASLQECQWSWSFKDVRFGALFSGLELTPPLREEVARLERYDGGDDLEKIAAYWAFAEKHIANFRHPRFMVVGYEPLLMAGKAGFARLVDFVGGPSPARLEIDRNSTVTTAARFDISAAERAHSWRAKLDGEMRRRIDAAVADIWPSAPVRDGELMHEAAITEAAGEPRDGLVFAT